MAHEFETPWVEKYRPTSLDDVVANQETITCLKAMARDGNMTNIILSGPPGTGKTTSILCLARALLGPALKQAVLELNASDDRGIDTVRTKIKLFAQQKVNLPPGRHKLVILDEADSITGAAQQALRRTMEIYSSTTRFALACNNSTKIIEPIQSRCAILRFTRLKNDLILERLLFICQNEHLTYQEDGLAGIIFTAEGDMRNAINNLQATHAGFGAITDANVIKACDQPHPGIIKKMLEECIQSKLSAAETHLFGLIRAGYSTFDLIETIFRVCKSLEMDEHLQLEFIKQIGVTHMCIADGLSSLLQIHALIARLCSNAGKINAPTS